MYGQPGAQMSASAGTATCWIRFCKSGGLSKNEGGDLDAKRFRLGDLTSAGHPRHPLRVAYSEDPVEFDVDLYLKRLGY